MLRSGRAPHFTTIFLALGLLPGAAMAMTDIEGVRGALRDNVIAHLELDDAPCDAPTWRVRRLNNKAERLSLIHI